MNGGTFPAARLSRRQSDNAGDELGYRIPEWHVALVSGKSFNDVNDPDTPICFG